MGIINYFPTIWCVDKGNLSAKINMWNILVKIVSSLNRFKMLKFSTHQTTYRYCRESDICPPDPWWGDGGTLTCRKFYILQTTMNMRIVRKLYKLYRTLRYNNIHASVTMVNLGAPHFHRLILLYTFSFKIHFSVNIKIMS